jgi:hypothetical protein
VVTSTGKAELRKVLRGTNVLGSAEFPRAEGTACTFSIEVKGNRITAGINGKVLFDIVDRQEPLDAGGIALACTQGSLSANEVRVEPV